MARQGEPEGMQELLFTLASDDRLALLSEIGSSKKRLTALSKVIDATPQETSRHLSRLVDSGLVAKDSQGTYQATNIGRTMLRTLPGIGFVVAHRDYFLSHDLGYLPDAFLGRISELSSCEYVEHFSQVLDRLKATITGGKEYVWLISDQPIIVGNAPGSSFTVPDLPVRLICEPRVDRKIIGALGAAMPHARVGTLPEVKIAMGINEKGSGLIFPDLSGSIDFGAGFYSEDPRFMSWCQDLFEYYWSKSRKLS